MWRYLSPVMLATNLLLVVALCAVAAPMMPRKRELPHDVRSLADLKQINLVVPDMPAQLTQAGINQSHIEEVWRSRLTRAGIELATGPDVPQLKLRVEFVEDPDVPDAAGMIGFITLVQAVTITRLDEPLVLPSYTEYAVGIDAKKNIRKGFGPAIDGMVDGFIRKVRAATEDRATRKRVGG